MRLAREGAGITVGERSLRRAVRAQRRDWCRCSPIGACRRVDAWAVFPGRRLMPARTRVFLDALQAKFSGPECQAIEQRVEKAKAARKAAAQASSG